MLMLKLIAGGFLIILLTSGCDTSTAKQRCLDNNTKAEPTKYTWTPKTGTLNSYLAPDDSGTCSVKVGTQG